MRYGPILAMLIGVCWTSTGSVFAQADAERYFREGKDAYSVGKYEVAWEAALQASKSDPDNPEVHLLLGQSAYHLGKYDEALESWKKTLALSPKDAVAAKMIEILDAHRADVANRIKFVEILLAESHHEFVVEEAGKCLVEKGISPADRAKLLTMEAESKIRLGKNFEAEKLLGEVNALYAAQADRARVEYLTGVARMAIQDTSPDGAAILEKLAAEQGDAPLGRLARFELVRYAIGQEVTPARIEALEKWLAENPQGPRAEEAQRLLIRANLTQSRLVETPTADAKLNPFDLKAISIAGELISVAVRSDKKSYFAKPVLEHFENYYLARGSYAAAMAGLEALLKTPLDRESRLKGLQLVAASKYSLAMRWLDEQIRSGKLPGAVQFPAEPPPELLDAVKAYLAVRRENPSEPVWQPILKLAAKVQDRAKTVLWPDKIEQLRGPDAWAIELAAFALAGDEHIEPDGVQAAVLLAMKTVEDMMQGLQNRDPKDFALAISLETMTALARHRKSSAWEKAMQWHCQLLAKAAERRFEENVKNGNAETNAKPSDLQGELIENLRQLVAEKADAASFARNLLNSHLRLWKNAGQWVVAEEIVRNFQKNLTSLERLNSEIDLVNLWIEEADLKQKRMAQAGFTVPRELDPLHKKALVRLYELQADLAEDGAGLPAIRAPWAAIVARYKALEYFDVAEAAIRIKAEKAVPLADEFADFQILSLQTEQAGRSFGNFIKQYRASDKLELLPEHKTLLESWEKFIVAHPTSSLAANAVSQIFGMGQLYEGQGAFRAAAGIYANFAEFAGGQKTLSQTISDRANVAQRAAFAEASALDALARQALAQWTADRKPDDAVPEKLSEEFAAAIAAYKKFIASDGESKHTGLAVNKIAAVALEYANLNAWEVAGGVYADLLGSNLKLDRPERLEFARAICKLGPALPEHARQMLSAITLGGETRSGSGGKGDESRIAGDPFSDSYAGRVELDRTMPADRQSPNSSVAKPLYAPPTSAPAAGLVINDKLTSLDSRKPEESNKRDSELLAMVRQEEASRAQRVAQLRERALANRAMQPPPQMANNQQPAPQSQGQVAQPVVFALLEAELAKQEKAISAAFDIFMAVRKNYPLTPTAEQARGEILLMAAHWRELSEWQRAAELASRFLADNSADPQLPHLRLEIARDRLAFAAKPYEKRATRQELLAEVEKRFGAARAELNQLLADFPKEKQLQQNAQWEIAMSYLTQARSIDAVSPTLAQGQYVRAAKELRRIAEKYADHPRLVEVPTMLWTIGGELEGRGYDEEAIDAWNELIRFDPLNNLTGDSLMRIAITYQQKLKRPLRAAEAYQELNFIRGGSDVNLQNMIFQIGTNLKNERRWVEALHVLETFVDSFPRHPQAGQALAMAGQIHQTNEAWADAIAAYRRVIDEYTGGQWVQEAKWSIAECTINLSQWKDATEAYREFVQAYPQDGKVAEANRRIEILKDLERYQGLIDEKAERKAFDAQFQIATIVRTQLNNPVKAIIEYRKVYANWPTSYLAGDALYAVGETYLSLGELTKARENLMLVAEKYPTSPTASNAMFLVGKSYEDEADKMGKVTREEQLERSKEFAQRRAYDESQLNRKANISLGMKKVADLKAAGKANKAEVQEAANSAGQNQFDVANVELFAQRAIQQVETMTATELADRQDKINAALRKAVEAYTATSKIAGGNKADSALLKMATIYDQRLKDSKAAMKTWLEIVRQFSGTNVAEDASWKIAQYYEREGKYADAVEAYQAFLRNYRRSPNAGAAQFATAENYEHLGEWVKAMDSYSNYITNFPDGPLVAKAKEQINWIKTYRL